MRILAARRLILRSPLFNGLTALLVVGACALPRVSRGHGSYDERVAKLAAELAERPDDPQLHFLLAKANCQHGDWEITLLNLQAVEKVAPGQFPTGLVRAEALLLGQKNKGAKQSLDAWISKHPESTYAVLLRARANARLDDPKASLADYREALRRTPAPEPELVQEVSDALARNEALEEALEVIGSGIDKLGPVPSLVLHALGLEVSAGLFEKALTRVDAMQESAPRPEPWMAKRASLLDQAGRREEARAAWAALAAHLAALPNLERGSHAMSMLALQASEALKALDSHAPKTTSAPSISSRP